VDSDRPILLADGRRYVLQRDGNELDRNLHRDLLMSATLAFGDRKLPSEEISVLANAYAQGDIASDLFAFADVPHHLHQEGHLQASLGFVLMAESVTETVDAGVAVGLRNNRFSQTDSTASDFRWQPIGDIAIAENAATLSEDVGMVTDLSQTFVVPNGVNTISFTLTGISMDVGGVADGNAVHPPEVFEVALMDSVGATSWMGEMGKLSGGDALLSIQANGTVYFADGVTVEGVRRSGRIGDLTKPIDVVISLPPEASGEVATLMFDLVGFGEDNSQVQVSNILLEASNGWQNPINPFDVDDKITDGIKSVSPLDALVVLNELARASVHHRSTNKLFEITDTVGPPPFYDVNGDGFITPRDALRVINEVARQQAAEPEAFDEALEALLDEM
jgi:hypothetical protein